MRVDMKRILVLLSAAVLAMGLVACKKSGYSSKISDVKSALEETCHAEKADGDQYEKMVDTKYQIAEVAEDFKNGVYTEVRSKDCTFFGFHAVVDRSDVKSVFKYIKADPDTVGNDMVANMEVLVIQFSNGDAAQKYFTDIMESRKQTYMNNQALDLEIKDEFVEKKEYFAFASESGFITYNVYASIDGSTVMYAFLEGPNSDSLKAEYLAFMKKMECSIITL